MTEPVGATEIASRAGVELDTVRRWRERHPDFPPPRWTVGGRPAWHWPDIAGWLRATGRTYERSTTVTTSEPTRYSHELDDADLGETPATAWPEYSPGIRRETGETPLPPVPTDEQLTALRDGTDDEQVRGWATAALGGSYNARIACRWAADRLGGT